MIWIAKNGLVLVGRSERDRYDVAPSIKERCYHCRHYRKDSCHKKRWASDWYYCRKWTVSTV